MLLSLSRTSIPFVISCWVLAVGANFSGVLSGVVASPVAGPVALQLPTALARETVELLIRKFGKEAVQEGGEGLAKRIDDVVAKYGDEGLEAIRKTGPRALAMLDEAGEAAPDVARWLAKHGDGASWVLESPVRMGLASRFGDDAVEAMIRLGEPAERIIQVGGEGAVKAVSKLSPRQGRQLAMLADDATDAALVKNSALMDTVSKLGDRGMEFVWNNKGALAVGAVLAAFIADPEPFVDGTRSLAETAANAAVAPVARGVASGTNWTLVILGIAAMVFAWYGLNRWRRERQVQRSTPRSA